MSTSNGHGHGHRPTLSKLSRGRQPFWPVRNEGGASRPRYSLPVAPRVLIVGGFLTMPLNYWPLRRRLLAQGAAAVDIAPVWPVDWALAAVLGMAPLMRRTRLAIMRSYQAADRRPIIVVGHSGG